MNKLETIMNKQRELQLRLGTDFSKLDARERAQFMKDHFVYLDQELQEALYEMPFFKAWKNYSNVTREEHEAAWKKVQMELVDSLHFFVNLLLCAGMTADDVYNMYMAKNAENHRRQDEGYTADKSYRDQSVEDVMKELPGNDKVNMCSVSMNGESLDSSDFVAVLREVDGNHTIFYNTDAVTLGIAAKLTTDAFFKELNKLPVEQRAEVENYLFGGERGKYE